eukprot:5649506-Prymnesium_polylepis.1
MLFGFVKTPRHRSIAVVQAWWCARPRWCTIPEAKLIKLRSRCARTTLYIRVSRAAHSQYGE